MNATLESPKELAARIGWPVRRIRNLIAAKRLRHHRVGGSIFIPAGAIDELLQSTEIEPCHVEGADLAWSAAKENLASSSGSSTLMDSKRIVQQARQTALKLKKRSKSS
jgi:excisionase family DNA binding protein